MASPDIVGRCFVRSCPFFLRRGDESTLTQIQCTRWKKLWSLKLQKRTCLRRWLAFVMRMKRESRTKIGEGADLFSAVSAPKTPNDTGHPEMQAANLTLRIRNLWAHLLKFCMGIDNHRPLRRTVH
ncbi:hypothetical protein EDC04DRAFT_1559977 [Pisolithus marmoratus]|nr:hypothetical protein EDC04DRAFT_1559977 [Pisolithus marmoratus]